MPCQSFSAWERSRKRGTLWLIGDPPASLCPRSGNMPTRSSSLFSWSTMVPVINTTWPPPFEGKRTRLPGLRSPAYPCSFLRIHDLARSTSFGGAPPLVFAGLGPGHQPGNPNADRNHGEIQYPNELAERSGRCALRSRVRIRSAEWRRADHWFYYACPTIAGGRPPVTSEPSPALSFHQ